MEQTVRKLVVIGAAESGIGAALLGKKQGWDVFVSDHGTISDTNKHTLVRSGIAFEENGHTMTRILEAALIVKSPGIAEKTAVMKQIRSAGIEVCSEIEFGYRYVGNSKIIAITGSNGKSTTTKLIYELLRSDFIDAALVGNIGYSFARRIAEQPADWYVIEVSSFQLDDTQTFRPNIAVLLNITPDHLDRYNYDFNLYTASKFRIAMFQRPDDLLIVNADDPSTMEYLKKHTISSNLIYISMQDSKPLENEAALSDDWMTAGYQGGNPIKYGAYVSEETMQARYLEEQFMMSVNEFSLKGKHNQYNCMAASVSALAAHVRVTKIRETLSGFTGLEHRLEFVAKVRGVAFINDSKATNVNSVWFALESMKQPVILILGGIDKGNDYKIITALVREKVKAIVCLGTDNTKIHEAFGAILDNITDTSSVDEAVNAAYALAAPGDVVLLSPACASFDLFKNFEDRGTQFKNAVLNL
jgi:UDP-N-acetylmuramoylalanine--D-glutamate ligase